MIAILEYAALGIVVFSFAAHLYTLAIMIGKKEKTGSEII